MENCGNKRLTRRPNYSNRCSGSSNQRYRVLDASGRRVAIVHTGRKRVVASEDPARMEEASDGFVHPQPLSPREKRRLRNALGVTRTDRLATLLLPFDQIAKELLPIYAAWFCYLRYDPSPSLICGRPAEGTTTGKMWLLRRFRMARPGSLTRDFVNFAQLLAVYLTMEH